MKGSQEEEEEEDSSKSVKDILKLFFSIATTLIVFDLTLYLAFHASRDSDCRAMAIPPNFKNIEKMTTLDKKATILFAGYMDFEYSFLVEHVLNPLMINRRILDLTPKGVSKLLTQNNSEFGVTFLTNCVNLDLVFDTIPGPNEKTKRYRLKEFIVNIPRQVADLDWFCKVSSLEIDFPVDSIYTNNKRLSYPCYRDQELLKGSKNIIGQFYVEELSIQFDN